MNADMMLVAVFGAGNTAHLWGRYAESASKDGYYHLEFAYKSFSSLNVHFAALVNACAKNSLPEEQGIDFLHRQIKMMEINADNVNSYISKARKAYASNKHFLNAYGLEEVSNNMLEAARQTVNAFVPV